MGGATGAYEPPVKRAVRRAKRTTPARTRQLGMSGGLMISADVLAGYQVRSGVVQAALRALRKLPEADRALIAQHGIAIRLLPVSGLENNLLGATTIVQDGADGSWRPTEIRIAAAAGLSGSQATGEIVQHEFGHAVAVLRRQDRSEAAAIRYARSH